MEDSPAALGHTLPRCSRLRVATWVALAQQAEVWAFIPGAPRDEASANSYLTCLPDLYENMSVRFYLYKQPLDLSGPTQGDNEGDVHGTVTR